ncbi:MAG: hypothetical protein JNN11_02435 [Candidatus Doudnabacteria bacterium]|nr:hypothetical protein [Candidatus Doudnabacteria bacterium]
MSLETIHSPEKTIGPTEGSIALILREIENIAAGKNSLKHDLYQKQLEFLTTVANPRIAQASWENKVKFRNTILKFLEKHKNSLPDNVVEALTSTIQLASYKDYLN